MRTLRRAVLLMVVAAAACSPGDASVSDPPVDSQPRVATSGQTGSTTSTLPVDPIVTVGAEVLADDGFALLQGKRVGLIANQTSLARGEHLIDLLHQAPTVELAAVFAPEHGVRGDLGAGERLGDSVDPGTGVTIFSLYADTRQPTPQMLAGIDVLVYDLQDVGARFYTYISTMGLAMQSAAEAGIPFVVLDRPNPSGGEAPAGFVLEPSQQSFIGQYPIPSSYGLTAGELARAIQREGWLDGLAELELDVVTMDSWSRSMLWPDTERDWVPPSPGLRSFEAALAYPGTVLFEATSVSYGGGTRHPFAMVGAGWVDGEQLAADLNARGLPGVEFESAQFRPRPLPGVTAAPRLVGERLSGVRYVFTDPHSFRAFDTGIHVLEALHRQAVSSGVADFIDRPETFDLLAGTAQLRQLLEQGETAETVIAATEASATAFAATREPYLLYD